jgi:hypothetical protein
MNNTEQQQLARGLAGLALRTASPETEKVATVVATLQMKKQANIDLSQIASSPYLQNALLGAGAGGLVGMLQPKNKRRSALNYALMGGLGGLGVTAAREFSSPTTPPPAVAQAGYDNSGLNTAIGLGSAGVGGYGGHKAHSMLDRWGKLDRAVDANPDLSKHLAPAVEKMRGAGKADDEIIEALSRRGAGRKAPAAAFRAALKKLPPVRGRYALPIAGAVALPTLLSSLRNPASE